MKRLSLVSYVIGISLGTVLVNCRYGVEYIQKISGKIIYEADISGGAMLGYIALNRVYIYLLLLFCLYLPIGRRIYLAVLALTGAGVGVSVSGMVLMYGAIGVLKVIMCMFPQWIFYGGAYALAGRRIAWRKHGQKSMGGMAAVIFLLMLIGVYTECYVCPCLR